MFLGTTRVKRPDGTVDECICLVESEWNAGRPPHRVICNSGGAHTCWPRTPTRRLAALDARQANQHRGPAHDRRGSLGLGSHAGLAEGFYPDAFWFNQLACSSPRLVIWVGDCAMQTTPGISVGGRLRIESWKLGVHMRRWLESPGWPLYTPTPLRELLTELTRSLLHCLSLPFVA